jgi:hypothetical protein
MNYVGNLKSNRLRKLFRISRYSLMQSLSIFRGLEGIRCEFTSLNCFWKIGQFPDGAGPPVIACFQTTLLQTAATAISPAPPDSPSAHLGRRLTPPLPPPCVHHGEASSTFSSSCSLSLFVTLLTFMLPHLHSVAHPAMPFTR